MNQSVLTWKPVHILDLVQLAEQGGKVFCGLLKCGHEVLPEYLVLVPRIGCAVKHFLRASWPWERLVYCRKYLSVTRTHVSKVSVNQLFPDYWMCTNTALLLVREGEKIIVVLLSCVHVINFFLFLMKASCCCFYKSSACSLHKINRQKEAHERGCLLIC